MSEGILTDQVLRGLYYNPVSGYQYQAKLYADAKAKDLKVSRAKIKAWFDQQRTYTQFSQKCECQECQNDGYRWVLTSIDCFSRFAFCTPVRRKHKEFM